MAEKSPTHMVFTTQRDGFKSGYTYGNPRFFDGTFPANIKRITVVGDWPNIERAAKDNDIPCSVVKADLKGAKAALEQMGADNTKTDETTTTVDEDNTVPIPPNYYQLPTPEVMELAKKLEVEAENRNDALKAISAIVKQRKDAASGIMTEDQV